MAGFSNEAAARALHDVLLPQLKLSSGHCKRACMCAGHVSRALAMRGHTGWQVCA